MLTQLLRTCRALRCDEATRSRTRGAHRFPGSDAEPIVASLLGVFTIATPNRGTERTGPSVPGAIAQQLELLTPGVTLRTANMQAFRRSRIPLRAACRSIRSPASLTNRSRP